MLGKRNLSKRYRKLEATSLAEQGKGRVIVLMLGLSQMLMIQAGIISFDKKLFDDAGRFTTPMDAITVKNASFLLVGETQPRGSLFCQGLGRRATKGDEMTERGKERRKHKLKSK